MSDLRSAPTPLDLAEGLRSVIDPEVGLDIVALGLIYDLRVDDGEATVRLTMTTPACPLSDLIRRQVGAVLQQTPGLRGGVVELVWDPPWSPTMVEPGARDGLRGGWGRASGTGWRDRLRTLFSHAERR